MRFLPLFLTLSIGVAGAQNAELKSENVRRTIAPWGSEGVTRSQARAASAATAYHWAAFSASLGDAELARLEGFGVEVLGFAGRPGGYRLYKVRVKGDASGASASLKSMPTFINLLPVLPEEKVTRKVLRGEFRSKRPKGMVQATIVFHRNLGWDEAEALLKGRVERILPERRNGSVDVLAAPQSIQALKELDEVARVEDFQEPVLLMERARAMTRVSEAQWGMDTLTFPPTPAWNKNQANTGDSIWIGLGEGIDEAHLDLRESVTGGTVRRGIGANDWSGISSKAWHGTIVAGVAAGNGWNSEYNGMRRYERRGVAPKAMIIGYPEHGDVNNHSWVNESRGYYSSYDAYVDDQVSRHAAKGPDENNVSVWAAGNNGEATEGGGYGNQLGYYSMLVNAKNPIKVGAVDPDGTRAGFSGIGPMRDGRLGPDVMAPGAPVVTVKIRTQSYDQAWGTSFASPLVAGIAALMLQKYKEQMMRSYGRGSDIHDHPMWNSTVRAILAHTARDMWDMQGIGSPSPEFAANGWPGMSPIFGTGPDFVTGYGLVDAKSALDYVNDNGFKERKINSGSASTWEVTVPAGQDKLSVTLAWDDPGSLLVDEATAYDSKLVNDLNLRIVGPAGQVYTALAPDHSLYHDGTVPADGMDPVTPFSVMSPGTQPPRQDDVGNLEHIEVPSPQAGVWHIEVHGTDIALDQSDEPGVNQDYSLVSNVPLPSSIPDYGTDLIVSKVVAIPSRPVANQGAYFQATVTNRGHQATPDISHSVGFFSGGTLRATGASQPLSLAAGQSTVITSQVPVTTYALAGITARANLEGRFAEVTLRNNPLSLPISQFDNIPKPWVSQDIGSVNPPGRIDLFGISAYRIHSGGKKIDGNQDEFHFFHRPLNGSGEIRIHASSNFSRSDTAKIALMIRESLTPGSKHVSIAITKAAGRVFQSRASDNGPTASTWASGWVGTYLRLVRLGNVFTAYASPDGSAWTPAGSVTIAMATQTYAGIGFASQQDSSGDFTARPVRVAGGFSIGISGRITDPSGGGVSGASVALSGCFTSTVVSDASGNYVFPSMPPLANCVVTPSHASYAFHPPLQRFGDLYDSRTADFFAWNSAPPSPWTTADIGAVGLAGGAFESSGIFTVKGSGADIQGTADAFRSVHRPLSGDGDIRARVDALTPTDPFAKAGVMLRDGTGANARNAFMGLTSSQGATFQSRSTAGGATAYNSATGMEAPYWVRLVRAGNVFTGYRSANGVAWTQQGQVTLALPAALNAGLAVTSHNNALVGAGGFSQVSVTSLAFTEADIGAPGAAGSRTLGGDQHSVKGAGADIWGAADAFHFSYQSLTGNGQITARVASIQNTNGWAKAGVMIREGLSPNARNLFMAVTPSQGATFQRRLSTGGASINTVTAAQAAPLWVRLVRTDDSFRAFQSGDGVNWTLMGEETLIFSASVSIGLAVTSHSSGVLATGVFDSVQR